MVRWSLRSRDSSSPPASLNFSSMARSSCVIFARSPTRKVRTRYPASSKIRAAATPSPPLLPGPQKIPMRWVGSVFLDSTIERSSFISRCSSAVGSSPVFTIKHTEVASPRTPFFLSGRLTSPTRFITVWATAWAAFSISSRDGMPRSSMAMRSSSFICAVLARISMLPRSFLPGRFCTLYHVSVDKKSGTPWASHKIFTSKIR